MRKKPATAAALAAFGLLTACTSPSDEKLAQTEAAQCSDLAVTQSGTLEGSGNTVGWIAGLDWGTGTLTLNDGTQHKFHYRGLTGLETGATRASFKGAVYNLTTIEDMVGVFYGTSQKFDLAIGKGQFVLNNSKCVVIEVDTATQGVQLAAPGPDGVHIQLAP